MKNVYRIRRSSAPYYRELQLDVMDIARYSPDNISLDEVTRFFEMNTSMSAWWQPIPCDFYDDPDDQDKEIPEISPWVGATLILSSRAYRLLMDSIKSDGEFLPIKIGVDEYYIFNCLSLGKDDLERSDIEFDGDIALWVNELACAPQNDKQLLFKSPIEKGQTLQCTGRFKNIVEDLDLKGLCFENL